MPSPDITYEWVQRRPVLACEEDCVCQWQFHLRATRGEAASYVSETVEISGIQKPLGEYDADEISKIAEAYRRINKWDELLKEDIEAQENAPRLVDGWNEETLEVDT